MGFCGRTPTDEQGYGRVLRAATRLPVVSQTERVTSDLREFTGLLLSANGG